MSLRRPTIGLAGALALSAIVVAACSGGASPPAPGSTAARPSQPVDDGTTRTTPAVLAAGSSLDGALISVTGFFTTDGTTHLLCDAILESYPPQCGGATIVVTGRIPAGALGLLESPSDPGLARVSWGNVEIRGLFHAPRGDARATIELDEIRVVPTS
jgi:hypothetical protein